MAFPALLLEILVLMRNSNSASMHPSWVLRYEDLPHAKLITFGYGLAIKEDLGSLLGDSVQLARSLHALCDKHSIPTPSHHSPVTSFFSFLFLAWAVSCGLHVFLRACFSFTCCLILFFFCLGQRLDWRFRESKY